jgi:predicted enzyme related to lactoylglutathione lyase
MADEGSMIGKVGWTDICVDDAAALRDFYQAVMGWGVREVVME